MKHFHQSSNPYGSRLLWAQHVHDIFFSIFHQFHQDGKHQWIALLRTGQNLRNESLGLGHSRLLETRKLDPLFPLPKTPKHAERVTTIFYVQQNVQKTCDQDTLLQRICCAAQTHSIGLTFSQVLQKLKDDRPSDGTATGTEGGTAADDLNGAWWQAWLSKQMFEDIIWTFGFGIGY